MHQAWGVIPNLHAMLAEAPAALLGHDSLFNLFGKTSFSPVEQQVVLLSVSVANNCEYCVAGHTMLARMAKMDEAVLTALRAGTPLPDARLEWSRKR